MKYEAHPHILLQNIIQQIQVQFFYSGQLRHLYYLQILSNFNC